MRSLVLSIAIALAVISAATLAAEDQVDPRLLLKNAGFQIPNMQVTAPDFRLGTLDGKKVTLSDFKGSIVLVNFWATWCQPCQLELPSLKALYEKEKGKGLVLLGIDQAESADDVNAFVKDQGMTFPVLMDTDNSVGAIYASQSIPVTYVIDKTGHIMARIVGYDTAQAWDRPEMIAVVEQLLAM